MSGPYLTADDQKRAAGEAAALLVESGMTVGLGTGSTAAFFVQALGARRLDIRGVPTSEATARLAEEVGIRLTTLDEAGELDLTVDGADEIDPQLNCIKAPAARSSAKLVWEASRRVLMIADAGKQVERLGAFPLSVEVAPFGHATIARRIAAVLRSHGVGDALTLREQAGERVRTDGGNLIYDAACVAIDDPAALGTALKAITGVMEHGLFVELAAKALIGGPDAVMEVRR